MLKKICLFFFLILSTAAIAQDEIDPGFGDEGGGDAADAPAAPIDNVILPLLATGIFISFYVLKKTNKKYN